MTATTEGPVFQEKVNKILSKMPAYPHKALDVKAPAREQATWIKASCDCGFNARISGKIFREYGTPICPACGDHTQV